MRGIIIIRRRIRRRGATNIIIIRARARAIIIIRAMQIIKIWSAIREIIIWRRGRRTNVITITTIRIRRQ